MSDNGPQFSCGEFREFAQRWDFEHVTSSPRYPQSNGQVERAIGIEEHRQESDGGWQRRPAGVVEL